MRKFMTVNAFAGEVFIGKGTVSYDCTKPKRPAHTHLMCPGCGKVWGSVLVEGMVGVRHAVRYVECEEHGGGVFSNFAEDAPEFEMEVLQHDFVVMFSWLELGKGKWEEEEVFSFDVSVGTGKKSMMLPLY